MKVKQEFFGYNPIMWMGVVEDNDDPIKLGRLKVRIFGWHSGSLDEADGEQGVKTEDLPWAQVMHPVNTSVNSGTGGSLTGIVKGTWVMGMFLDGEIAREPMVMGCIGGIPLHESLGPEQGFYDPDKKFPRDGASWTYKEKEPDTNRLARNDNVQVHGDDKDYEHNIINRKKQNQIKTKGGIVGFDIDEPVIQSWSKFKSKYPDNKVWETKMGHIFEVDDTAGFERIHIYHHNGTYINIDNGDQDNKGPRIPRRVDKVTGDLYTFVQRNDYRIVPEGDMRSLSRHYSHIAEGAYRIDAKSITIKGHTKIVGSLDVDRLVVGTGLTDTIVDINGITYGFEKGILTHRGI